MHPDHEHFPFLPGLPPHLCVLPAKWRKKII